MVPLKILVVILDFFKKVKWLEFLIFVISPSGRIGLVETEFGFHIIKVTDKDDLALIADVSKKIVPSEKTSNEIFRKATQFEMDSKKEKFWEIAKSKNYNPIPVVNIGH